MLKQVVPLLPRWVALVVAIVLHGPTKELHISSLSRQGVGKKDQRGTHVETHERDRRVGEVCRIEGRPFWVLSTSKAEDGQLERADEVDDSGLTPASILSPGGNALIGSLRGPFRFLGQPTNHSPSTTSAHLRRERTEREEEMYR